MPEPIKNSPLAALRHTAFRYFWFARVAAMMAAQVQAVAVGWAIYERTGSTLNLGLVGLAQFLPSVGLILFTGHVADRYDRRLVVGCCWTLEALAMALVGIVLATPTAPLWLAYAGVVLYGVGRAFDMPASSALVPSLIPAADFPNAVAVSASAMQAAAVIGPSVAGVLYAWLGKPVFAVGACLLLGATVLISRIQPLTSPQHRPPVSWEGLLGGIRYIRRRQIVLGAISLDLFAVLLGGATALLPAMAHDVFHADSVLLGVLRAAPGVGALITGLTLAAYPLKRRVGPVMLGCVALFGLGTVVFGLTTSAYVALAALLVMGAADMVSVFIRQTLVQLETPDDMRGRVGAVSGLFIGASNQLGEFESGLTATWLGLVPAVVVGGLGTLAVVGIWAWLFPALRRADHLRQNT